MSDYNPLLTSLSQLLKARLSFRESVLIDELHRVKEQAVKNGFLLSGRMGIALAKVHATEAHARSEQIIADLRLVRLSWSSEQLVAAENDLRNTILDLFKASLAEAAALAERIGGLRNANPSTHPQVLTSFLDHSNKASSAAASMVDAVINEIIAAARNDLSARTPSEKPSYTIQNTFNGQVVSVAQGGATVGSVNQTSNAATPLELAEAISKIIQSLPHDLDQTSDAAKAKTDLESAEKELKEGKAPFARIMQAIDILRKAQDIAIRAPETIQHIQALTMMLGF